MKPFTLERTQFMPISLETAWDFFSSPANLVKITPPDMDFRITSPPQSGIYAGQIINNIIGSIHVVSCVSWRSKSPS